SPAGTAAIYRRYKINCVHRHHNPVLSDEENVKLYGKCSSLHGHEYIIEVGLSGPLNEAGLVIPRPEMDFEVQTKLVKPYDKTFLNDKVGNTSGEIIAQHFYRVLRDNFSK